MGETSRRRARLHDGNSGGRTLTITTKKPRTKRRPKHPWFVLGTSNRQVDRPCLKLEVRSPTPSKQNDCHGAATSEILDLQPGSPRSPVETMEACTSLLRKVPKEPFTADQIWPINIRWLTPEHPLEKVAYRQPSEETFLFIPLECCRLYLHPCIGVCEALPVHPGALITAADVFTGPLPHKEAKATAVDLLDILAMPHSRMDTSFGGLSPRAVSDGPFGPECWKFISKVGLPNAQPEDRDLALELLKILEDRKRGQASAGCRAPSGSCYDSLHQDQQTPIAVGTPQDSAPAGWRDSDDLTYPGIMWDLYADSSPCTEAGELQGLLASSLLLAQPVTHPMQDTVFAYVNRFPSRVCPV